MEPNMEDVLATLGADFRLPGGSFFAPEGCEMAFQRLPGASWGPGWRQEGTLVDFGRKRVSQQIVWTALGAVLGPSWRLLGPFWVTSPPPGGGPGSLGEMNFWIFPEVKPRAPQIVKFYVFLECVPGSLSCFVLCCLPRCAPGGVANMQTS